MNWIGELTLNEENDHDQGEGIGARSSPKL
jgi:hypothetical protein